MTYCILTDVTENDTDKIEMYAYWLPDDVGLIMARESLSIFVVFNTFIAHIPENLFLFSPTTERVENCLPNKSRVLFK